MFYLLFASFLSLSGACAIGASTTNPVQECLPDSTGLPGDCRRVHQYSLTNRMSRYPFSKADKVLIISWKDPEIKLVPQDSLLAEKQLEKILMYTKTPINDQKLVYREISEVATLNAIQTDKLTSILYEYDGISYAPMPCYSPHHAIVFLKNEEVLEHIEICFQCSAVRVSDAGKMGIKSSFCTEKYQMLKMFFKDAGVLGSFGE